MSNRLSATVQRLKDAADEFGSTKARKQRDEWREPYAAGLRFVLLDLIEGGAWKDLVRVARSVRADAKRDLEEMSRQQDDWRRMSESVDGLRADVVATWKPVNTSDDWTSMHDRFVEDLVEKGMSRDAAQEAIADLGRADAREMIERIHKPIGAWALELDYLSVGRLAALAAADLSDAVGKFNQYSADQHDGQVSTSEIVSRLNGELLGLHEELKGNSRPRLEERARTTESEVDDVLDPLLRAAATLAESIATENDVGRAREGVDIADAIRLGLLVRSAARVVTWTSGWGDGSDLLMTWRAAARERRFASAFRAPPRVPLRDIGGATDGLYLSVEGWMGSMVISHQGRKVISTTTITDRGGHTLQVGLPYIKLDSGGIVPNTYARLVGTYHKHHDDFDGPVFIPGRRSLTQDSRKSWLDWLSLEMMQVMTPVAHNLCARWSWATGPNGAGNPLRYGTWASSRKGLR